MPEQPTRICDLLLNAARRWPDHPAQSCEGRTRTWRETLNRCHGLATLCQQAGVGKGDRVAFLGLNSGVCFETYYGPPLIGAITTPLNYRLSLRELVECVEDADPKVLITDARHAPQALAIKARCPGVSTLVHTGAEAPAGMLCYEREIARLAQPAHRCQLSPSQDDDLVMLFYTGGTTGRSKGVMLTNVNIHSNTDCSISLYRMQPHWRVLVPGPLFHLAAGARLFTCTALGGHAVILPKFDAGAMMAAIAHYRIDSVTLVPTMLQMLLDHPEFGRHDLSSLKMLAYGAAPMPVALLRRVIKAFPQVEIFHTYGMTEASPILTSLDSRHHRTEGEAAARLASVGRPAPHVELIIAGPDGKQLACGEIGEVLVRGDNIMAGYWRLPELTAQAMQGGWYHTGDAGYVDEDGFLYLEGRVKDMIISGGENVYPIEVENVLAHHPAVRECAVIGIPHETWGEAVHAVVVPTAAGQTSEGELIGYCRERLAHYKCPVSVTFRDQPMPLSPVNKILKTELRKPFWEGRADREAAQAARRRPPK